MLAIMAALAASAGEQAAAWGRMAYAVITLAGVALAIRQSVRNSRAPCPPPPAKPNQEEAP